MCAATGTGRARRRARQFLRARRSNAGAEKSRSKRSCSSESERASAGAALSDPTVTRYFTLNEIEPEQLGWHLNISGAGFADASAAPTPTRGAVEDWVYVNLTGDTHPMHVHLVTFQVLGRTPFDAEAYERTFGAPDGVPGGIDPTPFATGPMLPPAPEERGLKDTVKANPGFFTSIRAKFDLPAGVHAPRTSVHHCHIVEHEDNDMMQR